MIDYKYNPGMRREGQQARLILVRHLETPAIRAWSALNADRAFVDLKNIFDQPQFSIAHVTQAEDIGRDLLQRHPLLPPDSELPLSPDQHMKGVSIGRELARRVRRVARWETSPYLRAQQTSAMLREGAGETIQLPKERKNRKLREISSGDAKPYQSDYLYLATHPVEMEQFLLEGKEHYVFPNSESKSDFRKRIGKVVDLIAWRRKYRGTTVMVLHSGVAIEMVRQLTGFDISDTHIAPGSVTSLVADKKKMFRPRKFQLVETAAQL